jgi:hypothetical protein
LKIKKIDLRNEIAEHYYIDALDFLSRFDALLEDYSKTKRMKCFVDLLMGFECALKAHIFLSNSTTTVEVVYKKVRRIGHDLSQLADMSNYLVDRGLYEKAKNDLEEFNVFLRYSLDAYESFFPSYLPRESAKLNWSATLTNYPWLINVRNLLKTLIVAVSEEFFGYVTADIEVLLEAEERMRSFAEKVKLC